jgi:hypothetical protein
MKRIKPCEYRADAGGTGEGGFILVRSGRKHCKLVSPIGGGVNAYDEALAWGKELATASGPA